MLEARILQLTGNRDGFYRLLWDRLNEEVAHFSVFHFNDRSLGPVQAGEAFDRDYIYACLPFEKRDRLFFFRKEAKVYRALLTHEAGQQWDLLHAHTLFSDGYLAYRYKKDFAVSYVVAVRSTDLFFFRYRFYLRGLGRRILQEASAVIFLSPTQRDFLADHFLTGAAREALLAKARIIPNGIAPLFLAPWSGTEERPDPKKDLRILTVGHIEKNKNQLLVCQALALLEKAGYRVHYFLAGARRDEAYSRAVLAYPFATHLGRLSQEALLPYYRSAHAFVLPSHRETFGLVYAEALSQACPVLYTRGQGFDGQFPEGQVGYAVDDHSPEDLAEKLLRLLEPDPGRSKRLRKAAERFDWDRISEKYQALYRTLLARSEGR